MDDIDAPTARTRFASVQSRIPNLLPWGRDKSVVSTPSADGIELPQKPGSEHDVEAAIPAPEPAAPAAVSDSATPAAATEPTAEKTAGESTH